MDEFLILRNEVLQSKDPAKIIRSYYKNIPKLRMRSDMKPIERELFQYIEFEHALFSRIRFNYLIEDNGFYSDVVGPEGGKFDDMRGFMVHVIERYLKEARVHMEEFLRRKSDYKAMAFGSTTVVVYQENVYFFQRSPLIVANVRKNSALLNRYPIIKLVIDFVNR